MVDVCLVLEHTYPRVTGGVSRWVHDLVGSMPDVSFAVAHMGAEGTSGPDAYEPPENVRRLDRITVDPERPVAAVRTPDHLPSAHVYHALSTGLASDVAARAAAERGSSFGLTEHGLAWREARFGISACTIRTPKGSVRTGDRDEAIARDVAAIERAARRAYAAADWTATVCSANAEMQRGMGLSAERSHVIANALRTDAGVGSEQTERTVSGRAPTIGLVGRVVAIKDIGTFLRACRLVADARPDARFQIVGPLDHEPDYVERCLALAAELDLAERLAFTGETDPGPWFQQLDVAVLTSLSEAQPLALIEAMAAGVPVVSTAVGGTSELLRGGAAEAAGLLTPVQDPAAVARAIFAILEQPERRWRLSAAGRERARTSHRPDRLAAAYRALYDISASARAH
jgi:glycosyltransferase involved in cell wall biosynthesis